MELGETIRTKRTVKGMTLGALASASGVSTSMLSEIERGAKNPTIRVLCQIADALDCTVSSLIDEPAPVHLRVIRREDRRVLVDPASGVERHLLSPGFVRFGIEIVWYVLPEGADTEDWPAHRPGVGEHATIVRGRCEFRLGAERVTLEPGDSVSYDPDETHGFRNAGEGPCELFLVIDTSHAPPRGAAGG